MAKSEGGVGGDARSYSFRNQQRWPDDVVSFLELVKHTFENEPEKYKQFCRLLADYKNLRIIADNAVFQVHTLLKEHRELLIGFNQFLPRKYRSNTGDFNFEDALAFVNKIKDRFGHDTKVCTSFLRVFQMYKTGAYDVVDAFQEVIKLFEGHPDFIEEYYKFLPPIMSAQSQQAVKDDTLNYLRKVRDRFEDQPGKYRAFVQIIKDYGNKSCEDMGSKLIADVRDFLRGKHDLILGFNAFVPEENQLEKKKIVEYEQATDIIDYIKSRFPQEGHLARPFLNVHDKYRSEKISIKDFYTEVLILLQDYPNLSDQLAPFARAYLSVTAQ